MVSLVGDEDVAGFEVEVQHLLFVEVGQGREQFVAELLPMAFLFEITGVLGQKSLKVVAIDIVHADEGSVFVLVVGEVAHDVGVLQLDAEFKLLAEQAHVSLRGAHVFLGPLDAIHAVVFDKTVAVAGAPAVEQHLFLFALHGVDKFGVAHFSASLMNNSVRPFCLPAT